MTILGGRLKRRSRVESFHLGQQSPSLRRRNPLHHHRSVLRHHRVVLLVLYGYTRAETKQAEPEPEQTTNRNKPNETLHSQTKQSKIIGTSEETRQHRRKNKSNSSETRKTVSKSEKRGRGGEGRAGARVRCWEWEGRGPDQRAKRSADGIILYFEVGFSRAKNKNIPLWSFESPVSSEQLPNNCTIQLILRTHHETKTFFGEVRWGPIGATLLRTHTPFWCRVADNIEIKLKDKIFVVC